MLDENLSQRLVALSQPRFSERVHVETVFRRGQTDSNVWAFARHNDFVIVSKGNDFRQRVFMFGPPKVIGLNVGNAGTSDVAAVLVTSFERTERFVADPNEGLLVLP